MLTAQFINTHFVDSAERVAYVRNRTHEFEERRPRGYSATGCLLEPIVGTDILAFNDIPPTEENEYASTPGIERAAKFAALGHAEVNAIAFAARHGVQTQDATMTLAWFPCINCAAAIVKAGISRLIATEPNYDYKQDQYDFRGAVRVLEAGRVQITFVK